MLTDRGLECKFRIVGEGPDRSELSSKASDLGISDRITWLGAVDEGTLNEEYRRLAFSFSYQTRKRMVLWSQKRSIAVRHVLSPGPKHLRKSSESRLLWHSSPYELNELTDIIASILYPKGPIKVGPLRS